MWHLLITYVAPAAAATADAESNCVTASTASTWQSSPADVMSVELFIGQFVTQVSYSDTDWSPRDANAKRAVLCGSSSSICHLTWLSVTQRKNKYDATIRKSGKRLVGATGWVWKINDIAGHSISDCSVCGNLGNGTQQTLELLLITSTNM